MNKQGSQNEMLFQLNGKPSVGLAFPQAMQHVLAMLVGNITPPMGIRPLLAVRLAKAFSTIFSLKAWV